jgi:Fur family peroxide stress response transcriptional regulator
MQADHIHQLKDCNLRVTPQRLMVLKALSSNRTHLSVEDIQKALGKEFGTVSRASVYNILKSLVKARLVRELNIASDMSLYEYIHDTHLHFVCDDCRKVHDIHDFKLPQSSVSTAALPLKWRKYAREIEIVVRGVCKSCSATG